MISCCFVYVKVTLRCTHTVTARVEHIFELPHLRISLLKETSLRDSKVLSEFHLQLKNALFLYISFTKLLYIQVSVSNYPLLMQYDNIY